MNMLFMIDGRLVPPEAATVSVLDRGFLYGDSVFEAMRTYGGRPFALDEHMDRLEQSARRVWIDLPTSRERIADEIRAAVAAARWPESYIRVIVTRGTGDTLGLDPSLARAPLRVVIVGPLNALPPEAYARGINVITYHTQRVTEATEASGAKVANYLTAVLAMREARPRGAMEALIVDGSGAVLEGATSNVFLWRAGELVTPPDNSGILLGITRAHVLELAKHLNVPVKFETITLADLLAADEVFISSSIRELVPVVRVDDQPIASGVPGERTAWLLREFRARARASVGLAAQS